MIRLRRKSSRGRNHDSSIITSDFFNTIDPNRLFAAVNCYAKGASALDVGGPRTGRSVRVSGAMEFRRNLADHSALMPATLITLVHFSVYSPTNFLNSAGELAKTE